METEKIIFFRNFLFRCLVIGVFFAIFFGLMTFALWDTGVPMVERFFKVDEKELGELTLNFFLNVRIVLVFIFLAPALALHGMVKSKK